MARPFCGRSRVSRNAAAPVAALARSPAALDFAARAPHRSLAWAQNTARPARVAWLGVRTDVLNSIESSPVQRMRERPARHRGGEIKRSRRSTRRSVPSRPQPPSRREARTRGEPFASPVSRRPRLVRPSGSFRSFACRELRGRWRRRTRSSFRDRRGGPRDRARARDSSASTGSGDRGRRAAACPRSLRAR